VQLQNAQQRFEAQGLKLAAISCDSPAILKDFAERHKIEFPDWLTPILKSSEVSKCSTPKPKG
jgi:peroxiredoxin